MLTKRPSATRRPKRVPIVLQATIHDCGAACVCMVLQSFGYHARLAQIRSELHGKQSALSLAEMLRSKGFGVVGARIDARNLQPKHFPAICHFRGNHFVVVESIRNGKVRLVDPKHGRRTFSIQDYEQKHSGTVLYVTDAPPPGKHRSRGLNPGWSMFTRRLLEIPGAKRLIGAVLASSFVLQAFGLLNAWITKSLVDRATHAANQLSTLALCLGLGGFVFGDTLMTFARSALMVRMRSTFDAGLTHSFLRHLLSLPLKFFEDRRSGDLVMRVNGNQIVRDLLTNQAVSVVLDTLFAVGYLVGLSFISPLFTLVVLALGVVQAVVPWMLYHLMHSARISSLRSTDHVYSYLVDILSGIKTLKASGAEHRVAGEWIRKHEAQLLETRKEGQLGAVNDAIGHFLNLSGPLILLVVGSLMVQAGQFSLGTMFGVIMLANALLTPLNSLATNYRSFQIAGVHLDRLADALDTPTEQDERPRLAPRLDGKISLRNVSFQYSPETGQVLQGLNLEIEAGSRVAIVGRSGSGKSTLAMLLLGLYKPTEGTILFDDQPIDEFDLTELRSQVGSVLQDPFLFSATVAENISFLKSDYAAPEIEQVAKLAEIHNDIMDMPMGYDTLVVTGGASLSGGQRQRMALARALLSNPAILVLDEATSNLDALTEQKIVSNLAEVNCTQVIVAHRLSTIRDADHIVVLENGRLVEQGSHSQLLKRDGIYASLVSLQRTDEITLQPHFL